MTLVPVQLGLALELLCTSRELIFSRSAVGKQRIYHYGNFPNLWERAEATRKETSAPECLYSKENRSFDDLYSLSRKLDSKVGPRS